MMFFDLGKYDYELPPELIRKKGVEPRDSARLFVYNTEMDTVSHDFFYNLAEYLPTGSLMILNETRVVPARLWLRKETGGKIEVFVLVNEISAIASEAKQSPGLPRSDETSGLAMTGVEIPFLVDRKCEPGMKLFFPDGSFFEVVRQEENRFFAQIHPSSTPAYRQADSALERGRGIKSIERLYHLLDIFGETPVPHYLEGEEKESENTLRKRYQTVFAATGASVAAPTASLHFTDRVFASLDAKGIDIAKVTLDVGLGTFAPLRVENFETKKLHRERIEVAEEVVARLNAAKREEHPIIAVGTTALRTLESVSNVREFRPFSGSTDIFIFPSHTFHSADILITNFHLSQTSLILLVDAFLEHKGASRRIVELYREAIKERYAFYSFGDSMLIL